MEKRNFLNRSGKSNIKWVIAGAVLVAVCVIIYVAAFGHEEEKEDLSVGISYIQNLENKSTADIEKEIKAIEKEEKKIALENGELDIWQQFDDIVLMGDSRTIGFSVYEFLEERKVIAEGGATIRNIPDYVETLKNINPSNIVLSFGLNDISIGYWNTVEEYIAELDQMLALLHENLPDAVVYVNSIIPATDPAFQRSEKWRNIPDWNVSIKQHCLDNNIPYIDISDTMAAHSDLYNEDGIHVQRSFYQYWAIDIVTEVNGNE